MPEPPIPTHGTYAAYRRGCRCLPCRIARSRYRAALKAGNAPPGLVPVQRLHRTLQHLTARIGYRQIAKLAGLHPQAIRKLIRRQVRFVRRETYERLAALKAVPASGALVPAYRTRQMLAALHAEGWSRPEVAAMMGRPPEALRLQGAMVRRATAEAVEALYRNLLRDDFDWRTRTILPSSD